MNAAAPAVAATRGEPPILRIAPLLFVAMWSTGFIGAKYGAPVAGPFSLLFLRFAFVLPILAAVALAMRRPWPTGRVAVHTMVAGACIHGVYLGGIFYAVSRGLPAGVAGMIVGLQPILTALFSALVLGERIGRAHVAALVLGLAGVTAILWPQLAGAGALAPDVVLVALGAVAAIAFGTVWSKRTGSEADLVTGTALQFVGAALVLAPAAWIEGFHYVPSLQLALVIAWLVLVLSIGAVMLLLLMVRHGAVSKVATLFYLVPPTTAGFAYMLFDETLTIGQLLGTVAVVAAVLVATRPTRSTRS
jgi:drug/metabolite transporter (DMT)-like permease